MVNKVQAAYVVADGLFLLMGIFIIGFSVIVGNIRDEIPENGRQAARNLLYQRFPLTAGIVNAVFIFLTFMVTLPGLATQSRGWLKLGAYMTTFCGLFSMILGLFLWILTLKTREDFAPLYWAQPANVQQLMQAEVRFVFFFCFFLCSSTCNTGISLTDYDIVQLLRLLQQHLPRVRH